MVPGAMKYGINSTESKSLKGLNLDRVINDIEINENLSSEIETNVGGRRSTELKMMQTLPVQKLQSNVCKVEEKIDSECHLLESKVIVDKPAVQISRGTTRIKCRQVSNKLTSSNARHNKSPATIKPYLCLKGRLNGPNGGRNSPRKIASVKDKIKGYESKIKSKAEVLNDPKLESKFINPNTKKIKLMVDMFEVVHAQKEVAHAPAKKTIACGAPVDKIDNSEVKEDKKIQVTNAFDILMVSGGGKTPVRKLKRLCPTRK